MSKRGYRHHSAEFKEKVVQEWLEGEKSRKELEREHRLSGQNIRAWKIQYLQNGIEGLQPRPKGRPKGSKPMNRKHFSSEIERLEYKNMKLQMEILRLKKEEKYQRGNAMPKDMCNTNSV